MVLTQTSFLLCAKDVETTKVSVSLFTVVHSSSLVSLESPMKMAGWVKYKSEQASTYQGDFSSHGVYL